MLRVLLGLLLLAAAAPASALAANQAKFADPAGDAVFPGADLREVALAYVDNGEVAIGANTGVLVGGNRIDFYVDVDLNAATGWLGADYVLFYEQYGVGQAGFAGRWNGSAWELFTPSTLQYAAGPMAVGFSVHRSEIGNPAVGVKVFARGYHATGQQAVADWAPNSGSYKLIFHPTQVGGQSGGGEPPPAPELSVAQARRTIKSGLKRKLGKRARIAIGRCKRLGPGQVRCAVRARRGRFTWKGRATATTALEVSFSGRRARRGCRRCTRKVRW